MKAKILVIYLIFFPFLVSADYAPAELYELIVGADRIAYGEIAEMDSLTYTLRIEGDLSDSGTEEEIIIYKFQDWPCAWRWTDYKIGQKLFVFLKGYQGKYRILGAGNEGELPLQDGFVYINGISLNSPPAVFPDSLKVWYANKKGLLISRQYPLYGEDYFGYRINLQSIINTILTVKNCLQIHYGQHRSIVGFSITCDQNELAVKCENDDLLRWMLTTLRKKASINR